MRLASLEGLYREEKKIMIDDRNDSLEGLQRKLSGGLSGYDGLGKFKIKKIVKTVAKKAPVARAVVKIAKKTPAGIVATQLVKSQIAKNPYAQMAMQSGAGKLVKTASGAGLVQSAYKVGTGQQSLKQAAMSNIKNVSSTARTLNKLSKNPLVASALKEIPGYATARAGLDTAEQYQQQYQDVKNQIDVVKSAGYDEQGQPATKVSIVKTPVTKQPSYEDITPVEDEDYIPVQVSSRQSVPVKVSNIPRSAPSQKNIIARIIDAITGKG
jgi:hypothetical protein